MILIISTAAYNYILYAWIALALIIFPLLLKVTAPYGRHTVSTIGPSISNRFAWIIMELPVMIVFTFLFFKGPVEKSFYSYLFYGLFVLHYINRIFIFPMQLRGKNKKMPLLIVIAAIFFNLINGFINGYWFGYLSPGYQSNWYTDWRFIVGLLFFFSGMFLNITSDQKLFRLRKGGKTAYYIPYGAMFKYVSSPNLLGEIIEWIGWAMMSWCLPSFSFALWTFTNLVPRAFDHHRWYKKKFEDYPPERKAILPKIV